MRNLVTDSKTLNTRRNTAKEKMSRKDLGEITQNAAWRKCNYEKKAKRFRE